MGSSTPHADTGVADESSPAGRRDEMLAVIDVGLWYCDLPFDVLVWDRKVKEHFWLPSDATVTIGTFYERLHPDDRERTRQAIAHSIDARAPYDIAYRTVAPDGHPDAGAIRWVRAIGYTAYDDAGHPIRFDGVTVDITHARLAADRLAASEQRYEYASRATSNAIWDWDLTTDTVAWNAGVHTVFGYAPGQVDGTAKWWYERIHPDDRDRVVAGIHAVIDGADGGHAWTDEYRFRRVDGSHAVVVDRGYVARDARGRSVRMIGAMEDVTARRLAEAEHQRSEERFRALVDSTGQYIWTNDADGRMTRDQPGWARLTGQAPDEYAGHGWAEALHPDDRAATLAEWRRAVADGSPFEIEHRVRRPDGAWRHFWVRAVPVRDASGVREWVGIHTDITERKQYEQSLRDETRLVATLQRIGSSLTAELDLERVVQTVTDESTRLTGAQFGAFFYNVVNARGEAYTLYSISGVPREAFSKFPMPRNTHVFEPTFRGTAVVRSDDITQDPRYGKMAPHYGMPPGHLPVVSYLAVPVISHAGEVIGGLFFGHEARAAFTAHHERLVQGIAGWAAVAMDNARLHAAQQHAREEAERARQAALEAQRRAEHANRAKSDFLAAMSHDLRTPLNAIGGYVQLLEGGLYGPVTSQQIEAMARVQRAQQHLLALINDVLNFARIEAGKLPLQAAPLAVDALLAELRSLIEPQVLAKGLRYDQADVPAGATIVADRERALQVLLNLLGNAVKFTATGHVAVSVTTLEETVEIAVADTGRGIAPEKLATIFDPFVQLDRAAIDRQAGVGLGLAISRELARAMGGDVRVESTLGAGSVFTVSLPRSEPVPGR